MKKRSLYFVLVGFLASCSHQQGLRDYQLSSQTPLRTAKAEVIGSHSSGCLLGARALPIQSSDHELMRLSRGRFWAHPESIEVINEISQSFSKQSNKKMIIGDLGHARGGPSLSGHVSHQSGLDLDVWFKTLDRGKGFSLEERETLAAVSVLDPKSNELLGGELGTSETLLLKSAVEHPRVERVFVHPQIKRNLCQRQRGLKWSDDALAKIRPWWGHHYHFHIRLSCPESSPDCVSQEAPSGVACDETLEWWFSEEAGLDQVSQSPDYLKRYRRALASLPERCKEVLLE